MSKDFQRNVRDLYKSKGKKLSNEKEQSKIASEEKLDSSLSQLSGQTTISPLVREKLLKLSINIPANPQKPALTSLSFKNHKSEVQLILLSFGINFQRARGSAIPSIQYLYDQFIITHPEITHFLFKDCEDTIRSLHSQGLLYQLSPTILFEPLETSTDINHVFSLITPPSYSLQISFIQSHLPEWSTEKIDRIINILVDNGLAILDNNIIWFPQLE